MGLDTMGKVQVTATLENIVDAYLADIGAMPKERVRRVEVTDALVDSGANGLLVPAKLIAQLGLHFVRNREARGIGGSVSMPMYGAVRLTIQGRECAVDVGGVPDEFPIIVGQIPLEAMDWVIDMKNHRLIGNPEHGGEHVMEVL
jgi:hypothetical protein